jgi:hypothetical protein
MGASGGFALRGVSQWMTPNVPNGGHVSPELVASKGMMENGQKRTVGLESQSKYWTTPQAHDVTERGTVTHRPNMPDLVGQSQQWPTLKGTDGTKGGPNQAGSKGDLMLPSATAQWPTPAARDFRSEQGGGGLCEQAHDRSTRPNTELHGRPFFAPGPQSPEWPAIINRHPELAPALEPSFRGELDGMAFAMDESRAQRLKCVGNGVVALCAAVAFVQLAKRSGLNTQ